MFADLHGSLPDAYLEMFVPDNPGLSLPFRPFVNITSADRPPFSSELFDQRRAPSGSLSWTTFVLDSDTPLLVRVTVSRTFDVAGPLQIVYYIRHGNADLCGFHTG